MIIADTHSLLWYWTASGPLGPDARQAMDEAFRDDQLAVSAMTFWEVAMLRSKSRLDFPEDVGLWRRELLSQALIEIPVDGEIAARAGLLADIHGDPGDRIIMATALGGHRLVTADERILGWSGNLDRLDARQ